MGLVDLHCHILPGVDDGALDLRDAVAMARTAARDGIEIVCATPHIRADHDVRIHELRERVRELNDALGEDGVATRVVTGGEVAEPIVAALSDDELRACSLGGAGRWILLEPAAGPLDASTVATVERLGERGFRAVLAHPSAIPGDGVDERLREIARLGALIQITAAFVLDGSADWFVRERLVHVLASDAHSSHGGRPAEIAAALERVARSPELGPHAAWIATTAPHAIVAGRDAQAPF